MNIQHLSKISEIDDLAHQNDKTLYSPPDALGPSTHEGRDSIGMTAGRGLFEDLEAPRVPEPGSPQALACEKLAGRVARVLSKAAKAKTQKDAFGEAGTGLRNINKALIGKKFGLDFVVYAPRDPIWNFHETTAAIADAMTYGPGHPRDVEEAATLLGKVDLDLSVLGNPGDPRMLPLYALFALADQLVKMSAEEVA